MTVSNDLLIRCVLLDRAGVVEVAGSAVPNSEPSDLFMYPPRSTVNITPDTRFKVDLRFGMPDLNELTIKDSTCR